jgi:hypothetical protein
LKTKSRRRKEKRKRSKSPIKDIVNAASASKKPRHQSATIEEIEDDHDDAPSQVVNSSKSSRKVRCGKALVSLELFFIAVFSHPQDAIQFISFMNKYRLVVIEKLRMATDITSVAMARGKL